ncbi:MAG: hypothetical protein F4Y26_17010 [Gammaproteobacteria bacterium]|nr:hypothetical protein [Gammaproteobacteria bacterium]
MFPGSEHVRDLDLHGAEDAEVWEYARINALAIVSKDEDFHQLSFLPGPPPKVVWVRLGNCTTSEIEHLLRRTQADLARFDADEAAAFLVVGE